MATTHNDPAHIYTDDEIERLEKLLAKHYRQAAIEARKRLDDYFRQFESKDKEMLKLVKAGEMTQEAYNNWRTMQMATGQRWDILSRNLSNSYYAVDRDAVEIIREATPRVYAENYNYNTYIIENQLKMDTSFTLYNADAVNRVALEPPQSLYKTKLLNGAANKAYHVRKIQSETIQAILLGKSIPQFARGIATALGVSDMHAATTYARTMMTHAQNQGRYDAHKRAQNMGIDCQMMWVATLDGRTRHSHAVLDGETTDENGKFENGLRFPADTENGTPADWINCRCRAIDIVDGIKPDFSFRSIDDLGGMSYDEWKEWHREMMRKEKVRNIGGRKAKAKKSTGTFKSDILQKAMGDEYIAFAKVARNKENAALYGKYIDQSGATIKRKPNSGVYKSSLNEIEFDYNTHAGMNRYETLAHECGHLFDHQMGRLGGLSFTEIDKVNELCKIGSGVVKPLPEVVSSSDEFISALRKDMKAIEPNLTDICKELMETVEKRNATSGIQDALDGFFGTQKKGLTAWGHGNRYYDRRYTKMIKGFGHVQELKQAYNELGYNVTSAASAKKMARQYDAASEAWANINSAVTVGGDTLKYMEQYMPETLKVYKQIIKKVD